MNVIVAVIATMIVVFLLVRAIKNRSQDNEFLFWTVDENQQGSKRAHTGQGKARPEGTFRIPLKTTGFVTDKDERKLRDQNGTRYFEKD